MRVLIEIDCETITELCDHLSIMRRQVIEECKKKQLNPTEDEFHLGLELEDNNCYGTHELKIVPEPL